MLVPARGGRNNSHRMADISNKVSLSKQDAPDPPPRYYAGTILYYPIICDQGEDEYWYLLILMLLDVSIKHVE